MLPYKLLHAAALAEAGLVQPALAYCAGIAATLQSVGGAGGKGAVPPGLLVCRAVAADLQDRLQQYAAVSFVWGWGAQGVGWGEGSRGRLRRLDGG